MATPAPPSEDHSPSHPLLMEGAAGPVPCTAPGGGQPARVGSRLGAQCAPDLGLLDIQSPGIEGFEALRRLRADPATWRRPVVAASAMPADRAKAALARFDDDVTKPVDIPQLPAVVGRLLAG